MVMATEVLPPAQPAYVLRGHSTQIHALHFTPGNQRLLTADAEGWVISWNLAVKRPAAVWKAHANAILAVGSWGSTSIITYARAPDSTCVRSNRALLLAMEETTSCWSGSLPSRTKRI